MAMEEEEEEKAEGDIARRDGEKSPHEVRETRPTSPDIAKTAKQSNIEKKKKNRQREELRKLSWSGIPRQVRPITWKLLSIFERILFIWAIRHPASGYGINDLVTPFFVVYVFEYIEEEVENFDVSSLREESLRNIEADSFWCMSRLLDGIQDNYTFAQPGIQRKVKALEELVSRIDGEMPIDLSVCLS
ncbi:hypothetical protein CRUP_021126, partial [Coryphaenoides rupestris]